MIAHAEISRLELRKLIDSGAITLAGNRRLKIFGLLSCCSGMRMLIKNRVFFRDKDEACRLGYRPCGKCMQEEYRQ